MNYIKTLTLHKKTLLILAFCLSIPFVSIWYIVNHVSKDIFYSQKGQHLMSIAQALDMHLGKGGYDAIIQDAGMVNASNEQKIIAINEALRDITDEVSQISNGLGVGFYSLELDAMLTYGPSADYGDNVGRPIDPDHPGRQVMATNTPNIIMGTMVRGNIMNAMYPVVRNDKVIGYIWANELISDLELSLQRITGVILSLLAVAYILMLAIVVVFLRKVISTEQKSTSAIAQALEETRHLDQLMHIVNEAVASLLNADSETFQSALQNCMQLMGSAFDVDQIDVWRLSETDEASEFHLLAQWNSDIGKRRDDKAVRFGPAELSEIDCLNDWKNQLMQRQSVKLTLNDLTGRDHQTFSQTGVRSMIAVPVFLQEIFWGFVSFCNLQSEHAMTEDEEVVLLSGSLLMANAMHRNDIMQRLVLAREDALSGTRAKSVFLASMSHEIRTPMNAIIGMAAIGRSAKETDRKDYAFEKINNASTHLLAVINDVLDISKIESGKLEISPVSFDFTQMIQQATDVFNHRVEERKQILHVHIDPHIPNRLYGDDQRLEQVIINLLSNASKFTPEGGEIDLSARLLEKRNDSITLQIDVADTGIGISPEQQKRIFNSFEQAENSTTRKYGGTGLGLAISKNIIELMGGRIWLESEQGKGATFSFIVPAGCADGSHCYEGEESPDNKLDYKIRDDLDSIPIMDFSGRHILLVEDIEINREIFMAGLESTKINIDWAENGMQAVQMFREEPEKYELIFMDIQMPEMDGYEATRRIRSQDSPNAKTIPVIATTANVFKDDIDRCIQAGMNGHIGKPLDQQEVFTVLRKYLLKST